MKHADFLHVPLLPQSTAVKKHWLCLMQGQRRRPCSCSQTDSSSFTRWSFNLHVWTSRWDADFWKCFWARAQNPIFNSAEDCKHPLSFNDIMNCRWDIQCCDVVREICVYELYKSMHSVCIYMCPSCSCSYNCSWSYDRSDIIITFMASYLISISGFTSVETGQYVSISRKEKRTGNL